MLEDEVATLKLTKKEDITVVSNGKVTNFGQALGDKPRNFKELGLEQNLKKKSQEINNLMTLMNRDKHILKR